MEQSLNKLTLGVLYRKANTWWNMNYFLSRMKPFTNLNVKIIDVTDFNESLIPEDLDAITLLPAETDVLKGFLIKNKNIKWVHSMFAGVDKFLCFNEIFENDLVSLTNSRGAFADSLAEFSIFSMLYYSYNTPLYLKAFSERRWYQPKTNRMIKGKTLTIVGYGLNGVVLAKKARGFDMKIIGIKKDITKGEGRDYLDEIYEIDRLNEILPQTDFLVNILPHTPENIDFFDYDKFSKLKSTSIFINIGRGSTVKEEDLIKCLKERTIFAASLDVFKEEPLKSDSPFYDLDNVYLSFHSCDYTDEYFNQGVEVFVKNLDNYINQGKLYTLVDKKKGY